jgi:signal transduction histidine kinase
MISIDEFQRQAIRRPLFFIGVTAILSITALFALYGYSNHRNSIRQLEFESKLIGQLYYSNNISATENILMLISRQTGAEYVGLCIGKIEVKSIGRNGGAGCNDPSHLNIRNSNFKEEFVISISPFHNVKLELITLFIIVIIILTIMIRMAFVVYHNIFSALVGPLQNGEISTKFQIIEIAHAIHSEKEKFAFESKYKVAHQVAHDIRSPLTALNMVVAGSRGIDPKSAALIRSSVNRITDIANNLIQSAKSKKSR